MRALLTIVAKDLRLLRRDTAGLIFLTLAPIVVITVAGFSLASLYGSDPTGQTAYDFGLVDEDGGDLGRALRELLAGDAAVILHQLPSRQDAADRIVRKQAGTALVIPGGTGAALARGEPAELILYSDPVKYLERLSVRLRLLEAARTLEQREREAAAARGRAELDRMRTDTARLETALDDARAAADAAYAEARRQRATAVARLEAVQAEAQRALDADVRRATAATEAEIDSALARQLAELRQPVRAYVDALAARGAELEQWVAELRRRAGRHASEIPPPPSPPEMPEALTRFVAGDLILRLPAMTPPHLRLHLPALELPPIPPPPALALPAFQLPTIPPATHGLTITETNLTGAPLAINTFDQNVPGFSVTFLLLGMLLGVSLGLLDERDWGTLDRLRALPLPIGSVLVGKLLARFLVGVTQMIALLAVGWLAFGVSLGPQPWALLLPTAGIVFAGCAFGLVVAGLAPTRESVLPVGSIVIVTMAAVGGCWWPIDLEPRWMRTVALAFPTTWAMDAFNDLMIRRRTADAAVRPTLIMLAFGATYLLAGLALFRRRLR